MNPKKGLIGLLVLIFLISSVGLVALIYDDQKDLSSRASGPMRSSKPNILPGLNFSQPSSTWDGSRLGLSASINFDKVLWSEPEDKDLVFRHNFEPITVRLINKTLDLSSVRDLLGPDFTSPKLIGNLNLEIPDWRAQVYSFEFFGEEKRVLLAGNDQLTSVLAVYSSDAKLDDLKAFIAGITFPVQVLGDSTPDDSAQLATLVRPSVVMVLNRYCAEMKFLEAPGFALSGKNYPFCFVSTGTGFFVNKEGYLATNGHVIKNLPQATIFYAVSNKYLDNLLVDFLEVYLSQTSKTKIDRQAVIKKVQDSYENKEGIYQMAGLIAELNNRNYLKINNEKNQYYVQLGNNTAQVTKDGVITSDDVLVADYIDSNYSEGTDKGFSSSDVALLKVTGPSFPALPLGQIDDAVVGSNLQVVGFPGAASGAKALVVDTTSNTEPTFTKGVVSAIKNAKGDNRKLIQTDATIDHGNSGGPAITQSGKVVGIATYGITPDAETGRYNFLRDIQDLKDLMAKNSISENPGEIYQLWQSGLENYWNSYFKYAKNDFEKLRDIYPVHPMVDKYLKDTLSKVGTVADKTPRFTRSTRSALINLSSLSMAISALTLIGIFIFDYFNKKKSSPPLQEAPTF